MDRCLIWKTSRGKAVERDLRWNQWQMLFQAFFLPVSKNGLHGGLFNVGCIMNTEHCSLPRPNSSEVVHLLIACEDMKCIFSLSFSGNFLSFVLLVNYRRQIWEKMMAIYMVLLFQRENYTFFALFHRLDKPSDVFI